MKVWSTNLY